MQGFKDFVQKKKSGCGDYIRENLKNRDIDAVLVRKVLEKRIGMIYEDHAEESEIDEILDLAVKSSKTTGQAIGWVLENFKEDGKFEPQDEKFKCLEGGLAEEMTPDEIAEKHGVSLESIEAQLSMGRDVEKEHTDDPEVAERIAMDHLFEIPDYYTRLKKMEKEAKEELKR